MEKAHIQTIWELYISGFLHILKKDKRSCNNEGICKGLQVRLVPYFTEISATDTVTSKPLQTSTCWQEEENKIFYSNIPAVIFSLEMYTTNESMAATDYAMLHFIRPRGIYPLKVFDARCMKILLFQQAHFATVHMRSSSKAFLCAFCWIFDKRTSMQNYAGKAATTFVCLLGAQ